MVTKDIDSSNNSSDQVSTHNSTIVNGPPNCILQGVALWPAIVCLRKALLSQWVNGIDSSPKRLDALVGYLTRVPGLHLAELEPILAWEHRVSSRAREECSCGPTMHFDLLVLCVTCAG